jgi:dynein heavy chain
MLTLASNERIPLKPYMRLVFEIRDLRFATPATVSRAGILYISTDEGKQWQSLISSWLLKLQEKTNCADDVITKLSDCFKNYVQQTLEWRGSHGINPVVSLQDMNFVQTLLYMLDGTFYVPDDTTDSGKRLDERIVHSTNPDAIEKAFAFAFIWAMGSALTVTDDGTDNRKAFSDFFRSTFNKNVKIGSNGLVFGYWYDALNNVFETWGKSPHHSDKYLDYDSSTPMASVTVPTAETCSVTFWMKMLVNMRRPVMLCGPSGTGKTQIVNGMLTEFKSPQYKAKNPMEMLSSTINFNFYTTSAVLQNTMGIPLQKKTGSNFGPPGQARLVYFVDDLVR